jgi:hypothetical protein
LVLYSFFFITGQETYCDLLDLFPTDRTPIIKLVNSNRLFPYIAAAKLGATIWMNKASEEQHSALKWITTFLMTHVPTIQLQTWIAAMNAFVANGTDAQ